jgi:hypothetical protein
MIIDRRRFKTRREQIAQGALAVIAQHGLNYTEIQTQPIN